jgi:hypothetical protein
MPNNPVDFTRASLDFNLYAPDHPQHALGLAHLAGIKIRKARIACMIDEGRISAQVAGLVQGARQRWAGKVAAWTTENAWRAVDALGAAWTSHAVPTRIGGAWMHVQSSASAQASLCGLLRIHVAPDELHPMPRPAPAIQRAGSYPRSITLRVAPHAGTEAFQWVAEVCAQKRWIRVLVECSPGQGASLAARVPWLCELV